MTAMPARFFTLLFATLSVGLILGGCKTAPTKDRLADAAALKKKAEPNIPDQNGDLAFQAFLSRLRKAVATRDIPEIAGMMTADFGYRLEPLGEGQGVFEFWNENNIWPELELVLNEKFTPKGKFMVAPREFALNEAEFTGYRAGIQLVHGSWKFAYLVSG